MKIKIIYPIPKRNSLVYRNTRYISKILFFIIGILSIIINMIFSDKMWSLIVIWSLISIWNIFFSLKLVEFSIFSHINRIILHLVFLLALIESIFELDLLKIILPIVVLICLIIMSVIFYILHDKRDRNIISIITLGLLNIIMLPYALNSLHEANWLLLSFHIISLIILIILLISNYKDLIFEIKSRIFIK